MASDTANPARRQAAGLGKVKCVLAIDKSENDISRSKNQACEDIFCPILYIARRCNISIAHAGLVCELMKIGGGE